MIIGFPHPPHCGGPATFQTWMEQSLKAKGWRVAYPEDDVSPDAILVVGGTRRLWWLAKHKKRNVPIILRLDGFDWQYRHAPCPWSLKLRIAISERLTRVIRDRFASAVVYQSRFIRDCWYRLGGRAPCREHVIYNATDCRAYEPRLRAGPRRLVCIEGDIVPVDAYLTPVEVLSRRLHDEGLVSETIVCGRIRNERFRERLRSCPSLSYRGVVPREEIPDILQNSIYLPLEICPPCPNAVIEALACGAPVIGFDTGALRELVPETAGKLVPYGTDPWKLEQPDTDALVEAARAVLTDWAAYSRGARRVAEERFHVDQMTSAYMEVLAGALGGIDTPCACAIGGSKNERTIDEWN